MRSQRRIGGVVTAPGVGNCNQQAGVLELFQVSPCVGIAHLGRRVQPGGKLGGVPRALRLPGEGEQQLGRVDRWDPALQEAAELV